MRVGFGQIEESTEKRDYYSVIHKIDPYAVLERYGAMNVRQEDSKHEIVHSCLIDLVEPHHTNGDKNPSASLNTEQMLYSCYSYGGGDIFWLLMKMEQTDWRGIGPLVSQLVQEGYQDEERFELLLEKMFEREAKVYNVPTYNDRILEGWKLHHPYLYEDRGFPEWVLEKYGVGYDSKSVKITIPHYWEGKLVGWQTRRLDSPKYPKTPDLWDESRKVWVKPPKYLNTQQFPRESTLYGWDFADKNKPVVVVESAASVWRGSEYGMNIVATFGAKLHPEQLKKLRDFPEVVWFTDGDLPGLRSALKNVKELQQHVPVRLVLPPLDKDLDDCREDSIRLVEQAPPAFLIWEELKWRVKELEDVDSQVH